MHASVMLNSWMTILALNVQSTFKDKLMHALEAQKGFLNQKIFK